MHLSYSLTVQQFTNYNRDAKIVSEYDQEIPQSQTADNPVAPQGRAAQPSRSYTGEARIRNPSVLSQAPYH